MREQEIDLEHKAPGTPDLFPWRVALLDRGHATIFWCWAEDTAHAREQAENAYPGCHVDDVMQGVCSEGGDLMNRCDGCTYAGDYEFVAGVCRRRV